MTTKIGIGTKIVIGSEEEEAEASVVIAALVKPLETPDYILLHLSLPLDQIREALPGWRLGDNGPLMYDEDSDTFDIVLFRRSETDGAT